MSNESNQPYRQLVEFDDSGVKRIKEEDSKRLLTELNIFNEWLVGNNITQNIYNIDDIKIQPFSREDWIMKVELIKGNKQIVLFNPSILDLCEYDYFEIVILHEYFHLVVQKVPNKDDAIKIKDNFGAHFMSLIDIEADLYVATYLKKIRGITIEEYWSIIHKGTNIFADKWIRTKKFERFLGSLISVNRMFLSENDSFDLYLPSVTPVYTESHMKLLVVKKENKHICFEEIIASYEDFNDIKQLYAKPNSYSFAGYFDIITSFTEKALGKKPIPGNDFSLN